MKVLLLNQDWFAHELRQAGHEVMTCGFAHHLDIAPAAPMIHLDRVLKEQANGFAPDLIIWLDNSAPPTIAGLEELSAPILFYSVDTHHHSELHAAISNCFDHVFVAQKDYISEVALGGPPCTWLPLWASREVNSSEDKRFDAAFVGNLNPKLNPQRVEFFENLGKRVPIHIAQGAWWEVFPHSEIVLNQTVKGDLNFRVFEALMSGTLLLTERTPNGLLELFNDGEHLVTYERNNVEDAAMKVRALLSDRSRARKIARAGRDMVVARHRAEHRLAEVMAVAAKTSRRPPSAARYLSAMVMYGVFATMSERAGSAACKTALVHALRCADIGLQMGGKPNEVQSARLVLAAIQYERYFGTGAGNSLVLTFADAFPDNLFLQMAKIRTLLNRGAFADAEKIAREISPRPARETFHIAEQSIATLLDGSLT